MGRRTGLGVGAAAVVCLAACSSPAPNTEDVRPIVESIISEKKGPGVGKVSIDTLKCRLMGHGQSHQCRVKFSFIMAEKTASKQTGEEGLILRKQKAGWILIDRLKN